MPWPSSKESCSTKRGRSGPTSGFACTGGSWRPPHGCSNLPVKLAIVPRRAWLSSKGCTACPATRSCIAFACNSSTDAQDRRLFMVSSTTSGTNSMHSTASRLPRQWPCITSSPDDAPDDHRIPRVGHGSGRAFAISKCRSTPVGVELVRVTLRPRRECASLVATSREVDHAGGTCAHRGGHCAGE